MVVIRSRMSGRAWREKIWEAACSTWEGSRVLTAQDLNLSVSSSSVRGYSGVPRALSMRRVKELPFFMLMVTSM